MNKLLLAISLLVSNCEQLKNMTGILEAVKQAHRVGTVAAFF